MKTKYRDFSPRRIYWATVTAASLAIMLIIGLIGGAIWGLVSAIKHLPWTG